MTVKELYDFTRASGAEDYEIKVNISNKVVPANMVFIQENNRCIAISGSEKRKAIPEQITSIDLAI